MVRCEEKILRWGDEDINEADCFDDIDLKVKNLGLTSSDYIVNTDLRNKVAKM